MKIFHRAIKRLMIEHCIISRSFSFLRVFWKMEKFRELLRLGVKDIFSIFGLGISGTNSSTLQFLLLIINSSVVLTIMMVYMSRGKFFISSDPLSQATDLVDLFFPVLVHVFVMCNYMFNRKIFNEIHIMIQSLDKTFRSTNPEFFKKTNRSSILHFTFKFFSIHTVGLGIDIFTLIT